MQKNRKREDVSFRRMSNPLAPEVVLSAAAELYGVSVTNLKRRRRGGISRPAAARMLLRFSGCTQREIAELLGLTTGSAVSAQVRRINALKISDRKTRRELGRLEKVLRKQMEVDREVG